MNPKTSATEAAQITDKLHTKYTAEITVITSNRPTSLAKTYHLNDAGTLEKITVANMTSGTAEVVTINSLADFSELLQSLKHNQALCYGRPTAAKIGVMSKRQYEANNCPAEYIPRSKDLFSWPNAGGLMMLDYDPSKQNDIVLMRDPLLELLGSAIEPFKQTQKLWWPSSSSHICNGSDDLTGLRGQRIYIPVQDAADIPRAGKVMADLLWLSEHGYYEASRSGALLERCPIDTSVWQTNRLDFAAGANCIAPLEQRRGEPMLYLGKVLDTKALLPDLTEAQLAQLVTIKQQAKNAVKDDADGVKQLYIQEMAAVIAKGQDGEQYDYACSIVARAVGNGVLTGDFPIILESGERVTVGQLLDDPATYHGALTRDPLEPEYENNKVVGKLYLIGARPNLYSFAHGGKNFRLIRQPRKIEVVSGDTYSAVNETLMLLRDFNEVYDFGGSLVSVYDGKTQQMDKPRLAHWLGGVIQYWKHTDKGDERNIDPPPKLVDAILSLKEERDLSKLDAVITAPVVTPGGYTLRKPGYDSRTKLMLDTAEYLPPVPEDPTGDQVKAALNALMFPFKDFPFASALDKAVMLASLMTAVLRPVLPTAPGFAFDAPAQGSGKTLLASCVSIIGTGAAPSITPHTNSGSDDEIRKRLFSLLYEGSRAIVWDNVLGIFDSASLAALLTSARYKDRILGKSEMPEVPNKALFMMTGNNIMFAGDMPRRILKCRIDPQTDRPFARQFDLVPDSYCMANRQKLVAAVLTIVRGWFYELEQFDGAPAPGKMASFETWDEMVRQPIAWINRVIAPGQYADIMEAVDMAQASDPEQEALGEMLREIKLRFKHEWFTTSQLMQTANFEPYDKKPLTDAFNELARKPVISKNQLASILNFRIGRIVNGLSLEVYKCPSTKVNKYRLKGNA